MVGMMEAKGRMVSVVRSNLKVSTNVFSFDADTTRTQRLGTYVGL